MSRFLRPCGVVMLFTVFSAAGLAAQDAGGGEEGAEGHTTTQGVFNEDQAARGEEVMWNICAECHVDEDFGAAFMRSWEGATVRALLEEMKSTMPEDNPGGLRDGEYVDVVAYIFKLNGLPAGDDEMAYEALDRIKIALEP